MANDTNLVHFELKGSRNWLTGYFAKRGLFDIRLSAGYQEKLALLGDMYKEDIADRFNRTHGRTGETAKSMTKHFYALDVEEARYDINIAGNVGFVLNPLPPHFITGSPGLQNPMASLHAKRSTNFYSPFGPIEEVYWYQGGAESYSPDQSWYTDAADALQGIGAVELRKLAVVVNEVWHDSVSGQEILASGDFG